MTRESYKAVSEKLSMLSDVKDNVANEIIKVLKEGCESYADLDNNILSFMRHFAWNYPNFENSEIVMKIITQVNNEKGSLRIASCNQLGVFNTDNCR